MRPARSQSTGHSSAPCLVFLFDAVVCFPMLMLFQGFISPDSNQTQKKSEVVIDREYLAKFINSEGRATFSKEVWGRGTIQSLAKEHGYSYTVSYDLSKPDYVQVTFFKKETAIKGIFDEEEQTAIAGKPISTAPSPPVVDLSDAQINLAPKPTPVQPNVSVQPNVFVQERSPAPTTQTQFPPQTIPLTKSHLPDNSHVRQAWNFYLKKNWSMAGYNFAGLRIHHSSPDGVLDESIAICKWNAAMETISKYKSSDSFNAEKASHDLAFAYPLLQEAEKAYLLSVSAGVAKVVGPAIIAKRQLALARLYTDMKWVLQFVTPKTGNRRDSYESDLAKLNEEMQSYTQFSTYGLDKHKIVPGARKIAQDKLNKLSETTAKLNTKLSAELDAKRQKATDEYKKALSNTKRGK